MALIYLQFLTSLWSTQFSQWAARVLKSSTCLSSLPALSFWWLLAMNLKLTCSKMPRLLSTKWIWCCCYSTYASLASWTSLKLSSCLGPHYSVFKKFSRKPNFLRAVKSLMRLSKWWYKLFKTSLKPKSKNQMFKNRKYRRLSGKRRARAFLDLKSRLRHVRWEKGPQTYLHHQRGRLRIL